ncbi:hypothetical protein JRO89_XS12G0116100 [Xanthoceras sorbifolium]|uniref:Uncharacterized protein n=1 Tax=Xanthoceras sorbifolium TaxID=99658 RepID=A0ABQ8HCA4_9ROSI|nr:hypothetical protein JRO89_XS12G0116100 [Xanthoceras sorbifolium]
MISMKIKLLAVAARGGMETLRPALQRVYMTRASAYRDALKSFIEGYQEGIQKVMEKKVDSRTQQEGGSPKTSSIKAGEGEVDPRASIAIRPDKGRKAKWVEEDKPIIKEEPLKALIGHYLKANDNNTYLGTLPLAESLKIDAHHQQRSMVNSLV